MASILIIKLFALMRSAASRSRREKHIFVISRPEQCAHAKITCLCVQCVMKDSMQKENIDLTCGWCDLAENARKIGIVANSLTPCDPVIV